ncbi:MAG: transposase [Candidatus Omnitrophota bacterium]
MARKLRKYQMARSLIFHVVNRGILKQDIFHDDYDFLEFIGIVHRYIKKENIEIYHWCIMGNHYHIVMGLKQPERLSKIAAGWQHIYARKYHNKYDPAGRLFQGRFKSQAIEKENYLLACGRYVEQNPVRAKICNHAWPWQWSSARFYIYSKKDRLTTHYPCWKGMDAKSYKQFLEKAKDEKNI